MNHINFIDHNDLDTDSIPQTEKNNTQTPLPVVHQNPQGNGMTTDERHALRINCIAIANHIRVCPLCSQFYECDKKPHTVTIVILVIIVVLLVKKILNL